jgi:hypothetical protein
LGAALGALIATFVGRNAVVYAVGIFVCGIVASMLRSWSTYRVAAIAMSIVVLIAREDRRLAPFSRSLAGDRGGVSRDPGLATERGVKWSYSLLGRVL